jgi:hypothetical protein
MKKIMMLLLVAVFMMGFSGKAMASFTSGDLIRVVYQTNGNVEEATDLGAFSATAPFTTQMLFTGQDTFSASTFGTTDSNLDVAYFVYGGGSTTAWASGPAGGQAAASRSGSSWNANASAVLSYYLSPSVTNTGSSSAIGNETQTGSYVTTMDKTTPGNGVMGGLIPGATADANLAALLTIGYVDQTLYYYSGLTGSPTSVALATIQTNAAGTTVINPSVSSVPLPAAVYLFGSSLLGLVGLRRKMSV